MAKREEILDTNADDTDVSEKALGWYYSLSPDGKTCPICGAEFVGTDAEVRRNVIGHGRGKHIARIVVGYVSGKNINAIEMARPQDEEDIRAAAGVEVIEQLDNYDALALPKSMKDKARAEGGDVYLANVRNVERYKNWGMEVVTEDGNPLKRGDLFVMKVPGRLKEKRTALKQRAVANAPAARKEDLERRLEGVARNMYDEALKRGMPRDVARNLAKSAERGLSTGVLNVRR